MTSPKEPSDQNTNDNPRPHDEIRKSHQSSIQGANSRAARLYQSYSVQAKITFWVTIIFFIIFTLLASGMIGLGVYAGFVLTLNTFSQIVSMLAILGGVVLLLVLLSNNPLKLVRRSMIELVKINIIYSGFTHQIHQIDAGFKTVFTKDKIDESEIKGLSKRLHDATDQALDALMTTLEDFVE